MQKFVKYCLVGSAGFIVDSLCFFLLSALIDNIMLARLLAFWCAACTTYLGNKAYTYQHLTLKIGTKQLLGYMFTAHLSGSINLLVFWLTLAISPPMIAFSLGVLMGLFSNYLIINRFIFKAPTQ